MSRYFIEPIGALANTVCLQFIRDADIDTKEGKFSVDGEPHNVYEVTEANHTRIRQSLIRDTDNIQVIFWIDTGTEILKQLLRAKTPRI